MNDENLIGLQPGTVIAGRYEVVKCLGAGSMGLVYACRHRELTGHLVAIKVLFPEVARDKVAAARFRNEIFASYGVSHPNVVRAYEYIRDGDLIAYTMEYVGGGALADKLEGPRLRVADTARLLGQMCLGVQAIHDAGIVHRDLKPENILLTKDGNVKIADFGIAKAGHGPKLTEHGGVVGTIDYVSPEYMLNSQVDWRSDIYALGILGYELLTGESPFRGDSVYATMTKRLKSDPKPPSALRPECPPELDAVVLRAMARDPEKRYQSALDMFVDLQKIYPNEVYASGAYRPMGNGAATRGSSGVTSPAVEEARAAVDVGAPSGDETAPSGDETAATKDYSSIAGSYQRARPAYDAATEDLRSDWSGSKTVAMGDALSAEDSYAKVTALDPNLGRRGFSDPTEVVGARANAAALEPAPTEEWDQQVVPGSRVNVAVGGIDNSRIRKLSQLADTSAPSVWTDILILIFAALIGIAVGFVMIKIFFPDVFKEAETATLEG